MIKLPRDYGAAILTTAISALMLLVLAGEWLHFRGIRQDFSNRKEISSVQPDDSREDPPQENPVPVIETFDEMINRPLFIQGRRPPTEETEVAVEPPEPRTPLNAKLMGVVVTPGAKTALLIDAKGKYKRGKKNMVIDGWKVFEIKDDRVVMEQAGERKDLLLIKPKPKPAATPQAAKSPGRAIISTPGQNAAPPEEDTGAEVEPIDQSEPDVTDEEQIDSEEPTDE
jgi:hypothetical protein